MINRVFGVFFALIFITNIAVSASQFSRLHEASLYQDYAGYNSFIVNIDRNVSKPKFEEGVDNIESMHVINNYIKSLLNRLEITALVEVKEFDTDDLNTELEFNSLINAIQGVMYQLNENKSCLIQGEKISITIKEAPVSILMMALSFGFPSGLGSADESNGEIEYLLGWPERGYSKNRAPINLKEILDEKCNLE